MPVGTPSNDFYGGTRLGAGLDGESLVCLDAATGRRKWHFWGGAAFDASRGLLVPPTPDNADKPQAPLPLLKPPYGHVVAIGLNRGGIAWRV